MKPRGSVEILIGMGLGWVVITLLNVALLPSRLTPKVAVEVIELKPFVTQVTASGSIQPKRSVMIKADFDGPVLQKRVAEGSKVHQGDMLIEIGRNRIQQDFESKRYALANAEADLKKARNDQRLQNMLFRKQAVARSSVEDADRAVIRAQQALEIAQSAFRIEKERWNKNKIIAPFDGTVVKDSLEEEKTVSAGKELLMLADITELTVKAKVNELEIGQVFVGQSARVIVQALDNAEMVGTVVSIGARAESNMVPEVPVVLSIPVQYKLRLLPNMSTEVRIVTGKTSPTLSVPLSALGGTAINNYVWVVDRLGRLRRRPVVVGKSNPDRIQILKGLQEKDRVCQKVQAQFAEGLKVNLLE